MQKEGLFLKKYKPSFLRFSYHRKDLVALTYKSADFPYDIKDAQLAEKNLA